MGLEEVAPLTHSLNFGDMKMKINKNTIDKLPEFYRRQIEKTTNSNASKITNLECSSGNESLGQKTSAGLTPPVCIHIHSVRKRLADADGISGKAAIDGIIKAGILPDDKPEYVKEVSYSQEKGNEEYTVIIIEEIGGSI
jgi:hypothetical protein